MKKALWKKYGTIKRYQGLLLSKVNKISDVYMKQQQGINLTLAGKHQFIPHSNFSNAVTGKRLISIP